MTNTTQRLVKTSILLAIATVLSVVKLFSMPFGGTITPASMMPVILIAYIYGTKWGLFSAFIYGILQMITGMNVVSAMFLPGESQMVIWHAVLVCVIDYILAYMMLGFGGVFKNKIKNQSLSIVPMEWSEFVFLCRKGTPVKNSTYDTMLFKLCDKAGIPRFSMHVLRHTFATRCIEAGMKPKTLQTILGHSNIGITMNLYVHTTEEEKHKEIDLIADALKVI
jgi:thiamine transporter ThiT